MDHQHTIHTGISPSVDFARLGIHLSLITTRSGKENMLPYVAITMGCRITHASGFVDDPSDIDQTALCHCVFFFSTLRPLGFVVPRLFTLTHTRVTSSPPLLREV